MSVDNAMVEHKEQQRTDVILYKSETCRSIWIIYPNFYFLGISAIYSVLCVYMKYQLPDLQVGDKKILKNGFSRNIVAHLCREFWLKPISDSYLNPDLKVGAIDS